MKNILILIMILSMVSAFCTEMKKSTTDRFVPQTFNFQAAVKDADGMPVNDTRVIEFRIYDSVSDGMQLWSELHYDVVISDGIFSEELGGTTAFTETMFTYPELYITFVMGGEEMSPRQKLNAVPFAMYAENADNAANAEYATFADEAMSVGGYTGTDLVTQDFNGDANIMGTMTANAFVGDGSGLTNLTAMDDDYVNTDGPDAITANSADATLSVTNTGSGNGIDVLDAGEDGVYVHNAGYSNTGLASDKKNGFEVAGAGDNGLFVGEAGENGVLVHSPAENGVYVYYAGQDGYRVFNAGYPSIQYASESKNGFEVNGAEGNGLYVGRAEEDGVNIYTAVDDGIQLDYAVNDGVDIYSVGGDGVNIYNAGSSSFQIVSEENNGFEVSGAEGNGLYVGHADENGVYVKSATVTGVVVEDADFDGFKVQNAGNSGFSVFNSEGRGFSTSTVATDGYYIFSAGSPTTAVISNAKNGFEVAGAEGNGLFIGHADIDGISVNSSGDDGVQVGTADGDGLYVYSAGDDGIDVTSDVCGVFAMTTNASDEWGVYTYDKIHGSNVTSRSQSTHVKNAGSESLEAGDVVCIAGYEENTLGEGKTLVKVEKANSGNSSAVFGVVEYKVMIKEEVDERNEGRTIKSFTHAEGRAGSGEYLSVIVFGIADVKTDRRSTIKTGEKLTVSENDGKTRSIDEKDHWTIGVLGKALEDSNGKDTVKVFVNCK